MTKIIGIDLGTTNSVVAVIEGGTPTVIANSEGNRTTPSIVAITDTGEQLVGITAKRQAVTNPKNTVSSAKRFIGRNFAEVTKEIENVSYKVKPSKDNGVVFEIQNKDLTPQEISARVLQKMKQTAEEYLGEEVKQAVITVPAYFNDTQRQNTKDAGTIAGLDVLRVINEPTAAALAYGLDKEGKNETIAVYDLGGGTFDVSILDLGEGVFEVKSTNGDTHLGGDDFDHVLSDYIAEEFLKSDGIDLRKDPMALQRLNAAAEQAKCELSNSLETKVDLPFITADSSGPKHLAVKITRSKFEQLISSLVERSKQPCLTALKDAGLTKDKIDEVVLVGGSTRIPYVQELVKQLFGKEPHKGVNPDEVVAIGAAIQGGVLNKEVKDVLLLDVTPLSLGIETEGDVLAKLIEKNTTIPCKRSQTFSTASDNQSAVTIKVYQGERNIASKNKLLGEFNLEGIPAAPRGMPQIEVTFDIDTSGIVHVSAKDKGTGKEQKINITASNKLDESEIKKMQEDAEAHADEDKLHLESVKAKNEAEAMIYSVEKTLADESVSVSEEVKAEIKLEVDNLKEVLKTNDVEQIKLAKEKLEKASHKLAEELYKKAAAEQPIEKPSEEEEIVNAEIVE